MGRILAVDYGKKRCGLAVTDPLRIIANPLETVPSDQLMEYIKKYLSTESVDIIVFGMPADLQNRDTHITQEVRDVIMTYRKTFPGVRVESIDERFTSKIAFDSMLAGGLNKKKRAEKERLDRISATLILQSYLEQNS
ncbi:Holliday junction resolvase RuvX [Fulvivirga sedimenti]|uniref:Putative pre-16S rRNA nuclease n=1 Tax=Fulvivirga sedimenti TaxID=2879465 RepID=A0A9X1L373_9BACT|nr:Holliday junction resolvase RuvX [Fulvivirga sedimenti]MCA6078976.1 Holliday junction resolvase RuvX [Fulvivirga sedimenti]